MPVDAGANKQSRTKRLNNRIAEWLELRSEIKRVNELISDFEDGGAYPVGENLQDLQATLAELRDDREQIVNIIQRMVSNHSELYDVAVNAGFRKDLLTAPAGEVGSAGKDSDGDGTPNNTDPTPHDGGGDGSKGDGGGDGSKGDGSKGTDTGTTTPDVNAGDGLPGKKGKHWHVIRGPNGTQWVTYSYKLPNGLVVRGRWELQDADRKALGIERNEGRQLTRQQMSKYERFGVVSQIKGRGNKNPFEQFFDDVFTENENATWLKSKEVMGILMMAFLENKKSPGSWSETRIQNLIETSKWWKKRTETQQDWEQKSPETQKQDLVYWQSEMTRMLDQIFGRDVSWTDHFSKKDLERWSQKLASGEWGTWEQGSSVWAERMRRKAAQIEGTQAWIEEQGEINKNTNSIEDMYERVRGEAITQLGYSWVPDESTLRKWAERLFYKSHSDGDFAQYLRKLKQDIHPYLAPDEAYFDRASVMKGKAEQWLGMELAYDDDLLSNFYATDEQGNPLKDTAMTDFQWEQKVKSDTRYLGSRNFEKGLMDNLQALNSIFTGA